MSICWLFISASTCAPSSRDMQDNFTFSTFAFVLIFDSFNIAFNTWKKKILLGLCICTFEMQKWKSCLQIWLHGYCVILIIGLNLAYGWIWSWFIHFDTTLIQFHSCHSSIVISYPTHFDGIVLHSIPQYAHASREGFGDEFGFITLIHSIDMKHKKQETTIKSFHYFFSSNYLVLLWKVAQLSSNLYCKIELFTSNLN